MIGLVIVSHSRKLAEALAEMVRQVASNEVPLAFAAGVGLDRQELGTDAVEVAEAIQTVAGPEGVLVLVDLGSAVLSAEMALDLLPDDLRTKVKVCAAPLVEGAIAGAVQAGLGADLGTVYREASLALLPKQEHLGEAALPTDGAPEGSPTQEEPVQEIRLTLKNRHGLHARPAARIVKTAAGFQARIWVRDLTNGKGPVPAHSINALATLGAVEGHQISISATGPQASQAVEALVHLVDEGFGESREAEDVRPPSAGPAAPIPSDPLVSIALIGIPIAEGTALGPLYPVRMPPPLIPTHTIEDPQQEWNRLENAIRKSRQAIQGHRAQSAARAGEEQASIFDVHLLLLEDPLMMEEVSALIFKDHKNAAAAWQQGVIHMAARYQAVGDVYLQQRGNDLQDVGSQVLQVLAGGTSASLPPIPGEVILLAEEFTPGQIAQVDRERILGLLSVFGGPNSHSAILARSLGLPCVSGAPDSLLSLPQGISAAIDGGAGLIWIEPSLEIQAELQERRRVWLSQSFVLREASRQPAVTRDGFRVEVVANAGSVADAFAADHNGAEGIGVLRTEFLYLDRTVPPGEEEQVEILIQIGQALHGRPVIVRTLDVGGDKDLPYIHLSPEANPFLGVRGLRLSLQNLDLFTTQLRAVLRAAAEVDLCLLYPMVTNLEEVRQARLMLERAHLALQKENLPLRWPVKTGVMIEVPGAALLAPVLAPEVDFLSVGTNDLTQYTLAAERGNANLAGFSDALHPAVLRLIRHTVEGGHQYGKWVGVCGEVAADPLAAPVLIGLGVDELSLNPAGIPRLKATLASFRREAAQALAEQALGAENAHQVRVLASQFLKRER